jgi:hypothetical protein
VVAILFSAGDQEPLIPLFDVAGKGDIEAPVQIGPTRVNVGTTGWFTVIVIDAVVAH